MTFLATVLMLLASGDLIVLREKARVSGRYVRLTDLVDAERSADSARARIAEIFLGRSPEEGQSRIVSLDEIRRELERRGIHPDAFTLVGREVEVTRGGEPAVEAVRRTIAFEIKRFLLEQPGGARADETVVRVLSVHPDELPADGEVAEVRARGASDFTVVLVDPAKRKLEVAVTVRIVRTREIAFAAREIHPGKAIDRADLEFRRVEGAEGESASGDPAILVGAVPSVRIRQGAKISLTDLKLKPVMKKGDVVRVCSATFEVDAKALEDGAPGQTIAFEYLTSKNRVRAKVADAARAEVVEGGR